MTIGERIKERREYLGLSQEALSKKAGVSRAYIIQLENNRSLNPSAPILFNIAKALDVEILDLLGKSKKEPQKPLELTPGMKEAIKAYPVLEEVKDEMPNWRYRGKHPASPEDWYVIYSILKKGKKDE